MDLIDEVDYHCCIFCDKIFPADYELLMHVSEVHQNIMNKNLKPKSRDDAMEFIQSTFVDDEENIECDEYLETITNKSQLEKVKYLISTYMGIHICRFFNDSTVDF